MRVTGGGEARPCKAAYQISRWRCSGFRRRGGGINRVWCSSNEASVLEGRFAVFVIKGESPSNLRVAEVLKKDEDLVKEGPLLAVARRLFLAFKHHRHA